MVKVRVIPLSPIWLPLVRDHLAAAVAASYGDADPEVPDVTLGYARLWRPVDALRSAQLWWVSQDMTTLAVDTALHGPMPPERPAPSSSGLVVFAGDLPMQMLDEDLTQERGHRVHMPITALSWMVQQDSDYNIGALSTHQDVRAEGPDRRLPLWFLQSRTARVGRDDPVAVLLRVMQCVWALSAEPSLCTPRPATWGHGQTPPRALARPDTPAVTIVELRRATAPPGDGDVLDEHGRTYTHRWIVRGHYRNQAIGSDRTGHRLIWIAPHVKGPEGTPLIVTDQVRVWRR